MYRISRIQIGVSKLQIDRAISEFYRSRIFHGGDILMKILKIFKIFEKIKIFERNFQTKGGEYREGWRLLYELSERKPGWRFTARCHTPTVGKRKSRRPRTQVHLTVINMFLDVIASGSVLVSLGFVMYHISMIQIEASKLQIDRAISEFYRLWIIHGCNILMRILKIFKIFEEIKIEKES